MSINYKTSLINKLIAQPSPLYDLIKNRVDFGKRVDGEDFPGVVLNITADNRERTMKGFQGLRKTLIQIDCYSIKSSTEASTIAELIINAIANPWQDDAAGIRFERSDFDGPDESGKQEPEGYIYRARLNAEIWHAVI